MSVSRNRNSSKNRRARLKLNRMKYNAKKFIFSGRYIVRNALAVMIVTAVIALVVVFVSIPKKKDGQDPATANADTDTAYAMSGDQTGEPTLMLTQASMIDNIETTELAQMIADEQKVQVAAKDVQTLATSKYDMTGRFLTENDAVNIRETADPDGKVLGRLYIGGTGEVLEKGDEWTKVCSDGLTGYVATKLILMDEDATEKIEDYRVKFAVVKDKVRVRTYGNEASEVLFLAVTGDFFTVDSKRSTKDWTCVRLEDGSFGFVATQYVTFSEGFAEAVSIDEIEGMKDRKKAYKAQVEADAKAEKEAAELAAKEAEERRNRDVLRERADAAKREQEMQLQAQKTSITTISSSGQAVTVTTTVDELYLLAAIVYAESGSECYDAQLAVANVVMNRVKSSAYPNNIKDVIYQPYQFTATRTQNFRNALSTGGSSSALRAAQEAMAGKNNVGGCYGFKFSSGIRWDLVTESYQYGCICFFSY